MPGKGFEPRFTITNAVADAITAIERARGFLEAATLSEDWVTAMSVRALILEAHHTTHIEGTQAGGPLMRWRIRCYEELRHIATSNRDISRHGEMVDVLSIPDLQGSARRDNGPRGIY